MDPDTLRQLHALGYVGGPAPAALSDELAELAVRGPDPTTRIDDVFKMSVGLDYVMNRKFSEAEAMFREVVDRNPDSVAPMQSLLTALEPQDRPDDVIPLLRRLIELDPTNPAPKYDLAKLLRNRGENQEAEELFRQAVLLDECEVQVRLHLSELLRTQKRYAEQVAILEAGDAGCFESQIAQNALAFALATSPDDEVRDGARALEIAQRVVEETAGQHPDYLDTLACAHAELGQFGPAIARQKEAIALLEGHDVPHAFEAYAAHLASFESGEPVREE
jgi:tetratricopeptide (TPR) repeat protein